MACLYGIGEVFVSAVLPASHQQLTGFRLGHQLAYRLTIHMLEALDLAFLRFPVKSFSCWSTLRARPEGLRLTSPTPRRCLEQGISTGSQSSESSRFDCSKKGDLSNTRVAACDLH